MEIYAKEKKGQETEGRNPKMDRHRGRNPKMLRHRGRNPNRRDTEAETLEGQTQGQKP